MVWQRRQIKKHVSFCSTCMLRFAVALYSHRHTSHASALYKIVKEPLNLIESGFPWSFHKDDDAAAAANDDATAASLCFGACHSMSSPVTGTGAKIVASCPAGRRMRAEQTRLEGAKPPRLCLVLVAARSVSRQLLVDSWGQV